MRPLDADGGAEGGEDGGDGRQVVGAVLRERVGGTETGQVDGDDVAFAGQDVEDRFPGLPVVPDAVEQEQRLARSTAFVRQGHGAAAVRGLELEHDPCRHGGSLLHLLRRPVSKNYCSVATSSRARRKLASGGEGAAAAGMRPPRPRVPRSSPEPRLPVRQTGLRASCVSRGCERPVNDQGQRVTFPDVRRRIGLDQGGGSPYGRRVSAGTFNKQGRGNAAGHGEMRRTGWGPRSWNRYRNRSTSTSRR